MFCCFNNQKSNCLAITGLGASIFALGFLSWGIADLEFKRGGIKAIYTIAFAFIIFCMLIFISLIFLNRRKYESHGTFGGVARILCILIIGMCCVAFIFILVSFIVLLVDYAKFRSKLKDIKEYLLENIGSTYNSKNIDN